MKLYIDKENIKSLVQNRNMHEDDFTAFINLVKKDLDVQYNFENSDEIRKNQFLSLWFMSVLGQGVKSSYSFCPPSTVFPDRPIKSNFHTLKGKYALCSVYLLDDDSHIIKIIQNKNSVLIGNVGEEYNVIEQLFTMENKEEMAVNIKSWSNYCPILPLTDIIICDEHYFKNRNIYLSNNNEILTAVGANAKSQLNVVVIVKHGEFWDNIDLAAECASIKAQLSQITHLSGSKCRVTILTTYKTHSRHLITNYYRLVHTSCFLLKNNGLKSDVNTDVKSHARKNAFEITEYLLKEFQDIANSPVECYGDRCSNLIEFNH